jgi:hypothetical protein
MGMAKRYPAAAAIPGDGNLIGPGILPLGTFAGEKGIEAVGNIGVSDQGDDLKRVGSSGDQDILIPSASGARTQPGPQAYEADGSCEESQAQGPRAALPCS